MNEKRKLTAGFLNTLASGSIFAAFVGPAIGASIRCATGR
jgi:hypothetical protein